MISIVLRNLSRAGKQAPSRAWLPQAPLLKIATSTEAGPSPLPTLSMAGQLGRASKKETNSKIMGSTTIWYFHHITVHLERLRLGLDQIHHPVAFTSRNVPHSLCWISLGESLLKILVVSQDAWQDRSIPGCSVSCAIFCFLFIFGSDFSNRWPNIQVVRPKPNCVTDTLWPVTPQLGGSS